MKNTPEKVKNTVCRDIESLLAPYAYGELSNADLVRVEDHLGSCGTCREELEDIRRVVALFEKELAAEEAPVLSEAFHRQISCLSDVPRRKKGFLLFPGPRALLQVAAVFVGLGVIWAFLIPGLFRMHNQSTMEMDEVSLAKTGRDMQINSYPHGLPAKELEEASAAEWYDRDDGRRSNIPTASVSDIVATDGKSAISPPEMDVEYSLTPAEKFASADVHKKLKDAVGGVHPEPSPALPGLTAALERPDDDFDGKESLPAGTTGNGTYFSYAVGLDTYKKTASRPAKQAGSRGTALPVAPDMPTTSEKMLREANQNGWLVDDSGSLRSRKADNSDMTTTIVGPNSGTVSPAPAESPNRSDRQALATTDTDNFGLVEEEEKRRRQAKTESLFAKGSKPIDGRAGEAIDFESTRLSIDGEDFNSTGQRFAEGKSNVSKKGSAFYRGIAGHTNGPGVSERAPSGEVDSVIMADALTRYSGQQTHEGGQALLPGDKLNDPASTVAKNESGGRELLLDSVDEIALATPVARQEELEQQQAFSLFNAYEGEVFQASVFRQVRVNPFQMASQDNLSTFALDTDTASYRIAQNYLRNNQLPPPGAIRMEEFVNNFSYNYPRGDNVFNIHVQGAPSPFRKNLVLVKIGVQAKIIGREAQKPGRFVFLIDTSGSMARNDRMPLVVYSLELLLDQLSAKDTLSVITYGPKPRMILDAVSPRDKEQILETLRAIQCGGSTNLFEGVKLAYKVAEKQFQADAVNRIVLFSDGATNVGPTDAEDLLAQVKENRRQGINFTSIGFGMGNYNDEILETLANKGDGNYLFVGTPEEARQALVEDMSATVQYIAKDAKIQVAFSKARVRRYRLIGYENRDIADKDFRNDAVDAGEVGSGKSATALYELELIPGADPEINGDLGTVYVRYRNMETDQIEEVSRRITPGDIRKRTVKDSPHYFLAACAAEFAEQLRQSEYVQTSAIGDVRYLVEQVAAELPLDNQIRELARNVALAEKLSTR